MRHLVSVQWFAEAQSTTRSIRGIPKALFAFGLLVAAWPTSGQNLLLLREFPLYSNPAGIAVDATGVYTLRLTSQSIGNQTVSLIKLNSGGTELWTRSFVSSAASSAGGVAVTAEGLYVTATSLSGSGNTATFDIFVGRFTSAGTLLWTRQIRLPTANDFARAVTADDSGVYVVGQRDREGVIRKFDAEGNELWTLELEAPGDGYHAPLGISADAGGVYVAGVIQPTGEGTAGFLRKYTRNGVQVWDRQFGHIARGVAVNASDVFVVGWSAEPTDSSGDAGSNFLRRFSTDGDEIWSRHFGGMEAGAIVDIGVTADSSGVYVAGATRTRGALSGQCSQGAQDAVVLKFDRNGTEVWARQFGTWENDHARTVTTDATALYVAGDRLLAKFEKTTAPGDTSRPRIGFGCVVNAASHLGGGIAPGEIVTIFGSGIGPPQMVMQRIEQGRVTTDLAETRILFNAVPAPLLYVSDRQSSAVVPYGVAGSGSVQVQVEFRGVRSDSLAMPVLMARPGLFTRDGTQAVALNEDGRVNSALNPARAGSVLTLFATGEGLTSPQVDDGVILGNILPRPVLEVFVYFHHSEDDWPVAGQILEASGLSGSVPGLLHLRVRVPEGVASHNALPVSMAVRSGDIFMIGSQVVTVAVR